MLLRNVSNSVQLALIPCIVMLYVYTVQVPVHALLVQRQVRGGGHPINVGHVLKPPMPETSA